MLSKQGFPVPLAKRCSRCRATRPIALFAKMNHHYSGHRPDCKPCHGRIQARLRDDPARRERARQATAEWRRKNPRGFADWYAANRERRTAYTLEWRAANPDKAYATAAKRRATKRRARHEPYVRSEIFARWGGLCGYGCGRAAVHLDHIQPLSRGGADVESNLIPACAEENLSKGAKTLAQWALSWL